MEEINLKDLFSYFWSKKAIIMLITLLTLVGSIVYTYALQKCFYKSSTTIVLTRVNDSTTEEGGITQNDVILNQKLVSTYREIIKSRRILNQVINNLELSLTYEELKGAISVTNEKDTELIKISVSNESPKLAKEIADEIARVFNGEIVEIYSIKNVSIIDYAEEAKVPYNVSKVKQLALGILIGLVLSSAFVFVLFYFDTTVKSSDEVEAKLGLPILGSVPLSHYKRKGGKK